MFWFVNCGHIANCVYFELRIVCCEMNNNRHINNIRGVRIYLCYPDDKITSLTHAINGLHLICKTRVYSANLRKGHQGHPHHKAFIFLLQKILNQKIFQNVLTPSSIADEIASLNISTVSSSPRTIKGSVLSVWLIAVLSCCPSNIRTTF